MLIRLKSKNSVNGLNTYELRCSNIYYNVVHRYNHFLLDILAGIFLQLVIFSLLVLSLGAIYIKPSGPFS